MSVKIYEFKNCSTCKRALKFLDLHKITYENIPIVEQPPSIGELQKMLNFLKKDGASFKKLFNTSGQQYRELEISKKLAQGLTEDEAIAMLSKNGKLIKRPFLLTSKGGTVGFDEKVWKELF